MLYWRSHKFQWNDWIRMFTYFSRHGGKLSNFAIVSVYDTMFWNLFLPIFFARNTVRGVYYRSPVCCLSCSRQSLLPLWALISPSTNISTRPKSTTVDRTNPATQFLDKARLCRRGRQKISHLLNTGIRIIQINSKNNFLWIKIEMFTILEILEILFFEIKCKYSKSNLS